MPHVDTPWIGLIAVAAMFVLPLLPAWLFEGPRRIKHYPRRHVCAECGERWTDEHSCEIEAGLNVAPLRGDLRRVGTSTALVRRSMQASQTDE
jgi:hypothetical protein